MRKIFGLFIIILLVFGVSSCEGIKTYQDLDREFTTHLELVSNDYAEKVAYLNRLSTETLFSVVKIQKTSYFPYTSATGSGVIFTQDERYFYVLTNAHVIHATNQANATYLVYDYQKNQYEATLVAKDTSYDLAVLRITKGNLSIQNMTFATLNPSVGARAAILGYPSEQANAITIGRVKSYQSITIRDAISDLIEVNFDVIVSDNPVKPGSSGSIVVNDAMQLIGILYAGNFEEGASTSRFSFSIPVEKVIEFLLEHGFMKKEDES